MGLRGPQPGQKFGGRAKGTPNKNSIAADGLNIIQLARQYCPRAMAILADLMENAEREETRARCAEALADRGYGRPGQSVMISGDADKPLMHKVEVSFVSAQK